MSPKVVKGLVGASAILVILAVVALQSPWQDRSALPAAIGGPFTLVDQSGNTVTDQTYRGKIMLIYFGYTFCPDLCPTTLATLSQVLDQLTPAERSQIAPIFVTIDPERDTPQKMAEYVGAFSPALIGLTGSLAEIDGVEKAYRIYARKADLGDGTYGIDHSSILYVMGRDGRYLDHLDPNASAASLLVDIRKLLG